MATKDYKGRESPRPKQGSNRGSKRGRRGGSGFFWFVTGAVCGAFGVGFAWTLHDQTPSSDSPDSQAQAKTTTKPSFVFHQLLPEMEVLVPDEELDAAAPAPLPPKAPPAEPAKETPSKPPEPRPQKAQKPQEPEKPKRSKGEGSSYVVQVGSFRKASDAERLKAKLALLGVRANIQQVTVNGKAYHRVRTGPYAGTREVQQARAMLSSNGLESIAIRLK